MTLSEIFQRFVDIPVLAEQFPGLPPLAYFEFAPLQSKVVSQLMTDAVALAQLGFKIDPRQISEKTGYTLLPIAAPIPPAPG